LSTKIKIDQVLNIAGLLQPQSFFLLRKTLEKIKRGGVLEIVSDQKNSKNIQRSLYPENKYMLIEKKEVHGLFHYTIMKN